jgi:primary-amine oxidase
MTTTEDTPAATTAASATPEDAQVRHPLDPLTGAEIEAATSILKRDRHLKDSARFVYVTLREPAKERVLNHHPGQEQDREAHIVLRERAERKTYEAIVSLTTGDVKLWTELPGVQPAIMLEEFLATEEIVRKDPRWQEAMRRRGVTDFDMRHHRTFRAERARRRLSPAAAQRRLPAPRPGYWLPPPARGTARTGLTSAGEPSRRSR